jgi:lipopolysaccharide export system protein LptA
MTTRAFGLLLLMLCAAVALPRAASAQNCTLLQSGDTHMTNQGTPQQLTYVTVPVVSCPGGRRISASQAYISEASGSIQLMGNVQFQDSARTLTATNATYFSRLQRLSASGDVVLRHRGTNSIIRSQQLEYLEATPQREPLVQAMGGRPRAVLRQAGQQDSTVLDALQIDIIGDERLRGTGDAVLTRDSMTALAYIIEYSESAGVLNLSGLMTRIELPNYQLVGDSITATIGEDDQIQDVLSRHNATLESDEMNVSSGAIRLFFDEDGVARMVAMRWEPSGGARRADQSRVVNEQFHMVADSIDVLAPRQQLTEAVAIGTAYVERVTPAELRGLVPEGEPELASVIAHDWMRGDTIRAWFTGADAQPAEAGAEAIADAAAPPPAALPATPGAAATPTAQGERVLERLYAAAASPDVPAQTMHRMRSENAQPGDMLSIAYLIARNVEVTFTDGIVSVVTASDDVRGVYLQPGDAARRAPTETARAGGRQP